LYYTFDEQEKVLIFGMLSPCAGLSATAGLSCYQYVNTAVWWGSRRPLKARWSVSRHWTTSSIILDMRDREVGDWTVIW